MILAKYLVGITFVGLLASGNPLLERLYGDYHFAKEAVTLKLGPPNHYTYFVTKRARRGGAVTSTEISRGTFSLTGDTLLLNEFSGSTTMRLHVDSEEKLRVVRMKALESDDVLRCWNKYYPDGEPRLEAGWRKGKKHGTWVYYDPAGNVTKTETYRRGKLKE